MQQGEKQNIKTDNTYFLTLTVLGLASYIQTHKILRSKALILTYQNIHFNPLFSVANSVR